MTITVRNSVESAPKVTLFGQLANGKFAAKVMNEDEAPFGKCWDNAIDQRMVYIVPDIDQLDAIVRALNEGRLDYDTLQDYGGTGGGVTELPI
ncbi:hypothetical protein EDC30_101258 [Paucimonas lemoignei]|uniref:Uncharacterized protein n=1 Tax=Paucimonas lemoignei TaxID=29443 RepID=A0A4R3I1A0_PAULE|nr:hypothetical protein [Paucimonas lemoignei]TCS39302.1 hypothetical protein EDC30_101258 [Paucimonas lemoignei]